MLSKEIQEDVASHAPPLIPRWLRIPAAVKYSGLCRSHLYELIANRKIKSICLKSHKLNTRGVRLIDRESIDQLMLEAQIKEGEDGADLS
jgi:predicted DNA-binding transcriptional regulator AlpA